MSKRLGVLFATVCAAPLAGCGWSSWTGRPTNPVVVDYIKDRELPAHYNYQTISTDASRRTIFVRFWKVGATNGASGRPNHPGGEPANGGRVPADFVCAEPSPDALQAVANAVVAAARRGEMSGEVASTLATSAAPMLYRSQGLQLFRDQVFNLCLMRMNDVLKDGDYQHYLTKFADIAKELVKTERRALELAATRTPVVVSANPPPPKPPAQRTGQQVGAASDASADPQNSAVADRPAASPPAGSSRK